MVIGVGGGVVCYNRMFFVIRLDAVCRDMWDVVFYGFVDVRILFQ